MSQRQPIFNVPAVVVALLGAFVAVHLVRGALPDATDNWLVELLAFIPGRLGPDAEEYVGGPIAVVTQFVTHIFLHGDATHLAINSAWFLAFATPVARRIGSLRFLAFFLVCGVGGALLFLPLNGAPSSAMVGASGAISGLMGAALRFLFLPLMDRDIEALSGDAQRPLLGLLQTLTNRRILIAIAAWTLLNVLAARGAQAIFQERNIAWEAHVGGFLTGLLLFGLFDPPRSPPNSQKLYSNSTPAE